MALTQQEVTKINNLYKKIDELTEANSNLSSNEINAKLDIIEKNTSDTLSILKSILEKVDPSSWSQPIPTKAPKTSSRSTAKKK